MDKISIIKCFNCGCEVKENDTKCPSCNAIFEDTVYTNLPDDIYTNFMKDRNNIGDIAIGVSYIILIAGILLSIIVSITLNNEFSIVYALISSVSSFVVFLLVRGLAEVIQILHDIRRKIHEK